MRLYLTEIGQWPLLTELEEKELGRLVHEGLAAQAQYDAILDEGAQPTRAQARSMDRAIADGEEATVQFIRSNLRLVVSIAKRYQGSGLPLLDLIQEGNFGLIRAVDKFDYRKGFKFSTYATWWIRQAIDRGIANTNRTIRAPVHSFDDVRILRRAHSQLELELGREPTREEVAGKLGWTAVRMERASQAWMTERISSFSEPVGDDAVVGDFIQDRGTEHIDDDTIRQMMLKEVADTALEDMDERERMMVRLRFGFEDGRPWTLEEVGAEFGVTRERARQIIAVAIGKARKSVKNEQ